jgi:hypothetical protein
MAPYYVGVSIYGRNNIAITGKIASTPGRRFSDEINGNTDEVLRLEGCRYIQLGTNAIIGQTQSGAVRKSGIVFMSREEEANEERQQRVMAVRASEKHQAAIYADNWLLSGVVTLLPRQPFDAILTGATGGHYFLPVTSARAVYSLDPKVVVEASLILLNKVSIMSGWLL